MNYAKEAQAGLASANASIQQTPLQQAHQRLSYEIQDLKAAYSDLHARLASAGVLTTSPKPTSDQRPARGSHSASAIEQIHVFADHVEELRNHIRETLEDLAI